LRRGSMAAGGGYGGNQAVMRAREALSLEA
jgi:hypothetical protein